MKFSKLAVIVTLASSSGVQALSIGGQNARPAGITNEHSKPEYHDHSTQTKVTDDKPDTYGTKGGGGECIKPKCGRKKKREAEDADRWGTMNGGGVCIKPGGCGSRKKRAAEEAGSFGSREG